MEDGALDMEGNSLRKEKSGSEPTVKERLIRENDLGQINADQRRLKKKKKLPLFREAGTGEKLSVWT